MADLLTGGLVTKVWKQMHEDTSQTGVMMMAIQWADAAAALLQWRPGLGDNPSPCPTPSLSNDYLPTQG